MRFGIEASREAGRQHGHLYGDAMMTLVQDWRKAWGQGEFPYFWVQLANFGNASKSLVRVQEGQVKAAPLWSQQLPAYGCGRLRAGYTEELAKLAREPLADARGSVTRCELTGGFRAATVRERLYTNFASKVVFKQRSPLRHQIEDVHRVAPRIACGERGLHPVGFVFHALRFLLASRSAQRVRV